MAEKSHSQSGFPSTARKVFQGEIFSVYQWPVTLYDGSAAVFEGIKRPDTVGVLAVTSDEQVIITRQEQPSRPAFYSLLGGVVDPGEEPNDTAKRESLEEAGVVKADFSHWFSLKLSEKIDWTIHQYIARNCELGEHTNHDAGEKIVAELVSFEQFLQILARPDFRDLAVSLEICKQLALFQDRRAFKQWLFSGS